MLNERHVWSQYARLQKYPLAFVQETNVYYELDNQQEESGHRAPWAVCYPPTRVEYQT